ncbi:gamma carbonic anhydrase family protein [Crocinitomix catalasitica]|nr:gamma carbonic anhydrase family protein [Crocinitomix catalasitica]
MALIKTVKGTSPQIPDNCWLAENSTIVGDVVMGENCSIWFNTVIRGDVNSIRFGDNVNIQDGVVIHCTYENLPAGRQGTKTVLGDNVSVGHNAVVHGCSVGNNVLIGMGAIVMDNCIVEDNCIVAAGAVLLEGTIVESGSIWAGVPAKKVKDLSPELFEREVKRIAKNYRMYAGWFEESR